MASEEVLFNAALYASEVVAANNSPGEASL